MKKLKTILSLLLVVSLAVTSLFCGTVTASAANSTTALIKTSLSSIDSKASGIQALGQDLYILYNNDTGYRAICRIGAEEIKKWRSTGKLKATKITVDKKITGNKRWNITGGTTFENGDYSTLAFTKNDKDWYGSAVKYDKAKNKISEYYSTEIGEVGMDVSSNGTVLISRLDEKTKKLTFNFFDTTGKKFKTVTIDLKNYSDEEGKKYGYYQYDNGKYAVVYGGGWVGKWDGSNEQFGMITLIDEKGKKQNMTDAPIRSLYKHGNYYVSMAWPVAVWSSVYNLDTNKSYTIIGSKDLSFVKVGNDPEAYTLSADFGEKMFGSKAAVKYYSKDNKEKYALVDFSSGKRLTPLYDYMSSQDNGKTYVVKNSKGEWGYINSKGKKLAMFDDAGWFFGNGKYAPVIKNGKVYLINKQMKQISKTLKADDETDVSTLGDDLFRYIYGGKVYVMTSKS